MEVNGTLRALRAKVHPTIIIGKVYSTHRMYHKNITINCGICYDHYGECYGIF